MAEHTRKIPRQALAFAAELVAGDAAPATQDGATLFPFSMVARTKGVANHAWWGRCIHDFSGMLQLKPSISIDYAHDQRDVVGFADKIEVSADGLQLAGALVSMRPDDRAAEIAAKRKAGVPYEASIMTNWENLVIEEIPQGYTTEVNGETVEGPATVFRQWELWGCAICPYGSDAQTSLNFSAGPAGDVTVSVKGPAMTQQTNPPAHSGQEFLNVFGPKGGVWFAEGKTWEQAFGLFADEMKTDATAKDGKITELSTKIGELTGQLETAKAEYDAEVAKMKAEHAAEADAMKKEFAAQMGGKPLSGAPGGGAPGTPPATAPSNIDKFAAAIKLPGAAK